MNSMQVVVCTYNRCESLRDTLRALKAQTVNEDIELEVIVVDNNSADSTKMVVEEAGRGSRIPIRYLFEPRQGKSYACNTAIEQAQGEFVAFVDDDVVPESGWAQALCDAFLSFRADCVGGKVLPLWAQTPPSWLMSETVRKPIWDLLALLDHGNGVITANASDNNFLYGANFAFRKKALKDIGPFRVDLGPAGSRPLRGEDADIVSRFLKAGKKVIYTPHAIVHHKVSQQRMQMTYIRQWKYLWGKTTSLMHPIHARLPGWLVKECIGHGMRALTAYGQRKRENGIQHELQFWTQLGQIVGMVERRWRRYPQSA
ncbi:MAG: glycosyl transferase family 2 [Candidatus Omnitrophica bacterium CG11_big_fil_rev_8_21_14_0_20_63_9]|nr:MAG: glycosyl transferase family 2 [Candidatus Omnitrophica bacterium CG11_big_fil_rev_8_21_14_0_20_63_9]